MSHSIRQQLVNAQRFDIHACADQIARLVSLSLFKNPSQVFEATYIYNGENLEVFCGGDSVVLGDRLEGQFFDAFPEIEIEVKIQDSETSDVDGYYYHTVDPSEEDGLIEVIVKMNDSSLKRMSQDRMRIAIQSVLTHEMQHAVQRCYLGIDMAQVHVTPLDHLSDFREIDARVEEVLCDMGTNYSATRFKSKMLSYIHEYCRRNKITGVDVDEVVQNHTSFYVDKIVSPA